MTEAKRHYFVEGPNGEDFGSVVSYTETVAKTGRWVNRGTVDRVMWRAIPTDVKHTITFHSRLKDAKAYVTACGSSGP